MENVWGAKNGILGNNKLSDHKDFAVVGVVWTGLGAAGSGQSADGGDPKWSCRISLRVDGMNGSAA